MGWLWTFQLILDAAILWWLWKRLAGHFGSGDAPDGSVETSLRREDFERYHEALSDLCDRLSREGEGWVNRLEQKTLAARHLLERIEARGGGGERPVAPAREAEEEAAAGPVAGRSPTQQEVLYLRSQGYTVEQIARQLQLGQREVQLLLSLQQQAR